MSTSLNLKTFLCQHSSFQRGESHPPISSADIAGAFDLLRSYLDVKLADLKADLAS